MRRRLDPEPRSGARPRPTRRSGSVWRWLALAIVVVALGSGALALLGRSGAWGLPDPWGADLRKAAAVLVFSGTYVVVAVGKLPGLHIDRAGVALLGASLMVGCGALTLEDAYRAIDLDTITLLLGMMIVIANLRLSGFFRLVSAWAVTRARHPALLLSAIVLVTGVLSAFLVNDAICLVMTPLVIELTRALDRNPAPYLLGVAMASNVGSTATITGNPQNMIIGSVSHIPYGAFAAALAPVAGAGLVLTVALIALVHPREFFTVERLAAAALPVRVHRGLMAKSVAVALAMVALFFAGQPVAKVAIVGGALLLLLLLTRSVKAHKVYREIDWPLLVMFAGLFIVVAGAQNAVLTPAILSEAKALRLGDTAPLSAVTAVLSNLVSNVPAVLVLKPFVEQLADWQRAWLVVAMASTLAGNFTLVGSIANLIVAERARREGVAIDFWPYFRVGAPLTVITIVLGAFWLSR